MPTSPRQLKLAQKFPLLIAAFSALVGIAVLAAAWPVTERGLKDAAIRNLQAEAAQRAREVVRTLTDIQQEVRVVSEREVVANALRRFSNVYRSLDDEARAVLIDAYKEQSPYAKGYREALDDAYDGSPYSQLHREINPQIRSWAQYKKVSDVLLVNERGDVVYSMNKGDSFGSNLLADKNRHDGAADAFRNAMAKTKLSDVLMTDVVAPPSPDRRPALYFAAKIAIGYTNIVGAVVVEYSVERLNQIVADPVGLGETSESYLIGRDYLLRNDTRREPDAALRVEVRNPISDAAMSGKEGHLFGQGRRDREVLAAYVPIQFPGVFWALVVKTETEELFEPLRSSQGTALTAGLIAIFVTGLLGWLIARNQMRPLEDLAGLMATLAGGNLNAAVPHGSRGDEIGAMASALSVFQAAMRRSEELNETVQRNQERLIQLLNQTPIGVVVFNEAAKTHFVNSVGARILGAERTQITELPITKYIQPAREAEWNSVLAEIREKRHSAERDVEFALLKANRSAIISVSGDQINYENEECFLIFFVDVTERRQSEAALESERRKSSALFEGAPDATVIVNRAGKIALFNSKAEEVFGYNRKEVVGEGIEVLIPERLRSRHLGLRAAFADNPRARSMGKDIALMAVGKGGREFPVEISLSPIVGEDLVSATVRDISERRQAEAALRTFEFTIQNASTGIILINREGAITYANDHFATMLGKSSDAVVGTSVEDLLSDPGAEGWAKRWRVYAASDLAHSFEQTLLAADGAGIPCEVRARHMRFGDAEFVCAFVQDITERKRADRAIAKSKAELQAVLDNSPALIYMKDRDGRYIFANRSWSGAFGVTTESVQGKNDLALFPPATADVLAAADEYVLAKGALVAREEESPIAGNDRFFQAARFPLRNDAGEIYAVCGILTDITERKRSEADVLRAKDAAEEATKAKSSFLAMMSHEIRTPMNGVMSMAEMLEGTSLSDDQRDIARVIKSSADALLTIINDILDFSKIEAGKFDIDTVKFDPIAVIEGSCDLMAQRAFEKNLRLFVDLDPQTPAELAGDPNRLRQILLNLIGNAIKFTEKGSVAIKVRRLTGRAGNRSWLRFEITDTGIGMTEEQLGRLFQAFEQADVSTSRRFGGTGLGLTISKRIAEMMGGTIGVNSTYGEGATFWLELPFSVVRGEPAAPPADLAGLAVVAIGLDETGEAIVGRYLAHAGITEYSAAGYHDFEGAVSAAGREGNAVVVLLVVRDSVVGVEALDRLQAIGLGKLGVIVLTPRSMISTVGHAKQRGAKAILTLPLSLPQCWRAIAFASGRIPALDEMEVRSSSDAAWTAPSVDEARQKNALVLVAEDNKTNQQVIKRILGRMGVAFEMADDGQIALDMYQAGSYVMLLSDYHMPNMDGFALASAIRELEEGTGRHLPIVALTADAMASTEEHCLAAGMDAFLTKPINTQALHATIERLAPQAMALRKRPALVEPAAAAGAPAGNAAGGAGQQAAAAPEPTGAAVFNPAQLIDAFGSFDADARELVEEFIAGLPARYDELGEHLSRGDAATAKSLAHALKGSARSIGAVRLGDIAAEAQTALEQGNVAPAAAMLPALRAAKDALRRAVDEMQ